MKKIISLFVIVIFIIMLVSVPNNTEAKRTSYYKSAKTGKFTTKSYYKSHKATTYKSFRK